MSPHLPFARTCVLGAGSYGTALAMLATRHAPTLMWARNAASAQEINQHHTLGAYLPDIALPPALTATADFTAAVEAALGDDTQPALFILGVPVAGLADLSTRLAQALPTQRQQPVYVIHICKGFDAQTGELPHVIAHRPLQHLPWVHHGVLSGPSFALEVAKGLPSALTLASEYEPLTHYGVQQLHGGNARIYRSHDVIGVEVGGALKNIIAIACGISDGLGLGANARAALITRGLAEIQRIGIALGGQAETFFGLTGLGDLVLTATSDLSRNRRVGLALGQGEDLATILSSGMTAEGVRCTQAARQLAQQHHLHAPITEAVYQILVEGIAPQQIVEGLLAREPRLEA